MVVEKKGGEGRRVERHKERMWEGSKQAWMRRRPFQLLQLGVSLYILCLSFFSYQRQGIVQWHQTDGDSTLLYLAPLCSNCIVGPNAQKTSAKPPRNGTSQHRFTWVGSDTPLPPLSHRALNTKVREWLTLYRAR